MNDTRTAASAAHRVGSGAGRLMRAWRGLPHERRLAVYAAIGLFLTLFLPWYQETVLVANGAKEPVSASVSVTGWGAFSFVEAAVLLVAAGVLVLLFQRAEGKAFHVPGGDGGVITAAGIWTFVLVGWRIFDKQSTSIHGPGADISGIEWGIFVALAVAAFLAYAGTRIRAAHRPEPPLPGEQRPAQDDQRPAPGDPTTKPPSRRPRRASTPRPVAAEAPRTSREAREARPTRRRGSTARQAERATAQPDALAWKEPGTDWIDGQGRRTPGGAAAEARVQSETAEDRGTLRAGADEAPTLHRARDEPPEGRDRADDAQTERLGPSTQAARRTRRRDDS